MHMFVDVWGQDSRDKVLKCEIYQGSSQNLAIVFTLHIDLFCLWPPKSHKRSQGINEYKVVRLGILKHFVLAYTLLVADARIPDLTNWVAQFLSAPITSGVTMTGSCYDFLDEQNLDTLSRKNDKSYRFHVVLHSNSLQCLSYRHIFFRLCCSQFPKFQSCFTHKIRSYKVESMLQAL